MCELPQEREDRRRSSETLELAEPAEQQRWRGLGIPDNAKGGELGINPHLLQPVESTRAHSSTPGSSTRHSTVSESRLSQVTALWEAPQACHFLASTVQGQQAGRRSTQHLHVKM